MRRWLPMGEPCISELSGVVGSGDDAAHHHTILWREVHPFTGIDSLDIIHNVLGYLLVFAAGLIRLHGSRHLRGAVMEP